MSESETAAIYTDFARVEAHGESPLYEEWALGVADDEALLALVEQLPDDRRQPNLVFAAARVVGAPQEGFATFRPWVHEHWGRIRRVVHDRTTQTNEPARTIATVAALESVAEPIALLEVGASAGLCLYPDRYHYRLRTEQGVVDLGPASGVLVDVDVDWSGGPVPARVPRVVWRAGIDVHPLRADDPDVASWLEALVWPEQDARRARLREALAEARRAPATLMAGDAVDDLARLAALAPPDARLVVLHSAVLAYLPERSRRAFVEAVQAVGATWISVEAPRVLPEVAALLPRDAIVGRDFVVSRDGVPIGTMGPHGQRYRRFAA